MTPDWRPPYAYVPGQTPRHAEGLFDPIVDAVQGVPCDQLDKTLAWRMGLAFLEEGFFWEAHEVLEPLWMACPQNSPEKLLVQAIIQLANARLKQVMGRPGGRDRLMQIARSLAHEAFQRSGGPILGLSALPDSGEIDYAK